MKAAIEQIKRLIKNLEADIRLQKSFDADTFYLERYNAGLNHAVAIFEHHKNMSKAKKQAVRNRMLEERGTKNLPGGSDKND